MVIRRALCHSNSVPSLRQPYGTTNSSKPLPARSEIGRLFIKYLKIEL